MLKKGGVRGVPGTEKPHRNFWENRKNRTKNRLEPQNRKPLTPPVTNQNAYLPLLTYPPAGL